MLLIVAGKKALWNAEIGKTGDKNEKSRTNFAQVLFI